MVSVPTQVPFTSEVSVPDFLDETLALAAVTQPVPVLIGDVVRYYSVEKGD